MKRKRGRPHALDDVKRREIVALISAGCSISDAARYADCAVSTIHRDASRNEDFRRRIREAYLAAELKPLNALQKASTHHWRAAAWLLKRVNPERYAQRKEGTYDQKDIEDLMDQLLYSVTPEVPDEDAWERLSKRFRSILKRWEYERVEARTLLQQRERNRNRSKETRDSFPVIGRPIYKVKPKEDEKQLERKPALALRDAEENTGPKLIGVSQDEEV